MSSAVSKAYAALWAALVFVMGIEMMRFHFASLGWYQRDTLGIGAIDLIPVALLPFAAGAVLPLLSRVLSTRLTLWVGGAILVAARIVNQAVADPQFDHVSSGIAVAAFVGLLSVLPAMGRQVMVSGILLGITLDTAIKASGSSLDLAYRPGWAPLLTTAVMGAVVVYSLVRLPTGERAGPRWGAAATLLGLGPYLFVQYLVLQSAGWTAEVTGWGAELTWLRIVALNVVGLWLAHRFGRTRLVVGVAAVVVGAAVVLAEGSPLSFNLVALLAVPAAGPLLAGLVPDSEGDSLAPSATFVVGGSVLFLMIGFAYYLPLDLRLGFSQAQARTAGAVLVAVFGLAGAVQARSSRQAALVPGLPVLALAALLLPAVALLGRGELPPPESDGSVRVMSYNLHQAFGTAGDMDVEAIAEVILNSDASVVGLQEVARAGLLNAGTDLVLLLGERLGWEHVVFHGTTDPVWGNAILSRYPLGEVERSLLPTVDTPYQRGFLAASVEAPVGEFLFISTHLQHINDSAVHDDDPEADLYPVHTAQIAEVIELWAGRQPAVLVGDFNARPDWRQVDELLDAGWVDAWAETGSGPGYTSNAADPRYRIDYVFHTPDIDATGVNLIDSQASDHLAVVADLVIGG